MIWVSEDEVINEVRQMGAVLNGLSNERAMAAAIFFMVRAIRSAKVDGKRIDLATCLEGADEIHAHIVHILRGEDHPDQPAQ